MASKMSEEDAREAAKIRLEMQQNLVIMRKQEERSRLREEEFKRREIEHQIRMSRLLKASVGLYDFNMCKRDEPMTLGKRTDSTRATDKSGIEGEIETKNKIGNLKSCDSREGDKYAGKSADVTEVVDYVDNFSATVTKYESVAELIVTEGNSVNFEFIGRKAEGPSGNSLVLSAEDKHSRAEERSIETECEEIADDGLVAECMRDVATVDSTRSGEMPGSGEFSFKGLKPISDVVEIIVEPMENEPREIVCSEVEQIVCVGDKQEREPTEELGIESAEEVIIFRETCKESGEVEDFRVEENVFASNKTEINVEDGEMVGADGSGSSLSGEVMVKGVKVWSTTKTEITKSDSKRRSSGGFSCRKRKQEKGKIRNAGRYECLCMKEKGRLREAELEICEKNFDAKMKGQSRYELSVVIILLRNWRFRKKIYVRSKLITAYV